MMKKLWTWICQPRFWNTRASVVVNVSFEAFECIFISALHFFKTVAFIGVVVQRHNCHWFASLPVCEIIWSMSSGYKALCFCPWPAGMLLPLQCFSLTSSFRKIIGMTVTGASINAPLLAQIKPDVVTGWYHHWEAGGIWGIAGIWLQN